MGLSAKFTNIASESADWTGAAAVIDPGLGVASMGSRMAPEPSINTPAITPGLNFGSGGPGS